MNKDIVIIGSGIAGLKSAIQASLKSSNVLLIESENTLGGNLRYGSDDEILKIEGEKFSPKSFIEKCEKELHQNHVEIWKNSFVSNIKKDDNYNIEVVSKEGIKIVTAKTIIISTGAIDKSFNQAFIAGTHPAGIFSLSTVNHYLYLLSSIPCQNCVVFGSNERALRLIKKLLDLGVEISAVVEKKTEPWSNTSLIKEVLDNHKIPLYLSHTISKAYGVDRLEAVQISKLSSEGERIRGSEKEIKCDTLILAYDLSPATDLLTKLDCSMSLWTKGAKVDQTFMTSSDGVYSIGNSLQIYSNLDYLVSDSKYATINALKYRYDEKELIDINFDENFSYITPELIDLNKDLSNIMVYFKPSKTLKDKTLIVTLNGKEISNNLDIMKQSWEQFQD